MIIIFVFVAHRRNAEGVQAFWYDDTTGCCFLPIIGQQRVVRQLRRLDCCHCIVETLGLCSECSCFVARSVRLEVFVCELWVFALASAASTIPLQSRSKIAAVFCVFSLLSSSFAFYLSTARVVQCFSVARLEEMHWLSIRPPMVLTSEGSSEPAEARKLAMSGSFRIISLSPAGRPAVAPWPITVVRRSSVEQDVRRAISSLSTIP